MGVPAAEQKCGASRPLAPASLFLCPREGNATSFAHAGAKSPVGTSPAAVEAKTRKKQKAFEPQRSPACGARNAAAVCQGAPGVSTSTAAEGEEGSDEEGSRDNPAKLESHRDTPTQRETSEPKQSAPPSGAQRRERREADRSRADREEATTPDKSSAGKSGKTEAGCHSLAGDHAQADDDTWPPRAGDDFSLFVGEVELRNEHAQTGATTGLEWRAVVVEQGEDSAKENPSDTWQDDNETAYPEHHRPFGGCTIVVRDLCFSLPPRRSRPSHSAVSRLLASPLAYARDALAGLKRWMTGDDARGHAELRQSQYLAAAVDTMPSEDRDCGCRPKVAANGAAEVHCASRSGSGEAKEGASKAREIDPEGIAFKAQAAGDCPEKDAARSAISEVEEEAGNLCGIGLTGQVIVHPFSSVFAAGTMTAVMGPSGCGKTTLLNMMAARAPADHYTGDVFVNGEPRGRYFNRVSAYIQQDDIFDGNETVRECLEFSRDLRMNFAGIADSEERQQTAERCVERALSVLGLKDVAESRVGNEAVRGVSGGQKRRLTLGLGLMSDAQVFFCDEPTTGLSTADALAVIRALRRLCDVYSMTVVAVIHQPSMEVLRLFDNLLLFSCEGRCTYNGTVAACQEYFERLGYAFPLHQNPADFLSDLVSPAKGDPARLARLFEENEMPRIRQKVEDALRRQAGCRPQFADACRLGARARDAAEERSKTVRHPGDGKTVGGSSSSVHEIGAHLGSFPSTASSSSAFSASAGSSVTAAPVPHPVAAPFSTGPWTQFGTVARRSVRLWLRDRGALAAIFGDAVVEGVILGLVMLRVRQTQAPYYHLSALFLLVYCVCASALWTVPLLIQQKPQFIMEVCDGYYAPVPYLLASTLVANLFVVLSDFVIFSILWVLVGFEGVSFPFCFFVSLLAYFVVDGAFALCSLASTSFAQANSTSAFVFMLCTFTNGFTTNPQSMPTWIGWLSYVSPFFLAFEGSTIRVMNAYDFGAAASERGGGGAGGAQLQGEAEAEADLRASAATLHMGHEPLESAEDLYRQYGLVGREYGSEMAPQTYKWLVDVLLLVLMALLFKVGAAVYMSFCVIPGRNTYAFRPRRKRTRHPRSGGEGAAGEATAQDEDEDEDDDEFSPGKRHVFRSRFLQLFDLMRAPIKACLCVCAARKSRHRKSIFFAD
ncbi:hypothetical protein BESB_021040 [Besnoitia besnoiti]|uniref:ABC transporter domain-containing protein n=1 Tax=Besnoitia besnoiti TaxID=94643 RepID=A0A2A9M8Z5_BESBE|nr:hypothetical protein BESB_021040 [Besnoitia besnoiti]PFH32163.1 hypothetical protein BESB_021040 [Besnoitia besnoiti]